MLQRRRTAESGERNDRSTCLLLAHRRHSCDPTSFYENVPQQNERSNAGRRGLKTLFGCKKLKDVSKPDRTVYQWEYEMARQNARLNKATMNCMPLCMSTGSILSDFDDLDLREILDAEKLAKVFD